MFRLIWQLPSTEPKFCTRSSPNCSLLFTGCTGFHIPTGASKLSPSALYIKLYSPALHKSPSVERGSLMRKSGENFYRSRCASYEHKGKWNSFFGLVGFLFQLDRSCLVITDYYLGGASATNFCLGPSWKITFLCNLSHILMHISYVPYFYRLKLANLLVADNHYCL